MIEINSIEDLPVSWVVDFWATWCWPCNQLKPIFEWLETKTKVDLAKCDVDKNPSIASKFRIMWVPTLVYFKYWKPVLIESWVKTEYEILKNIIELWIEE
jgi:thioredoxin 1